jgi:hypothetical protein
LSKIILQNILTSSGGCIKIAITYKTYRITQVYSTAIIAVYPERGDMYGRRQRRTYSEKGCDFRGKAGLLPFFRPLLSFFKNPDRRIGI